MTCSGSWRTTASLLDQLVLLAIAVVTVGVGYRGARRHLASLRTRAIAGRPGLTRVLDGAGAYHPWMSEHPSITVDRPAGPADARPAHLGHRPLQLPVHLLHAARGVRRGFRFLPRAELLTFEEIARLARLFIDNGVTRSGSPAASRCSDATWTAGRAARRHRWPGRPGDDHQRRAARRQGAQRWRVPVCAGSRSASTRSTMGLRPAQRRGHVPVARVVEGIEAAEAAGLAPIKIDTVVRRGHQRGQRPADGSRGPASGLDHPVHRVHGRRPHNGWRMEDVVPAAEILRDHRRARCRWSRLAPNYSGRGGQSLSLPRRVGRDGRHRRASPDRSAATCTRARLSAEGQLYLCLFGVRAHDLKRPMRAGAPDGALGELVRGAWGRRTDRYSEIRSEATTDLPRVEMSHIGG